MTHKRPSYFKLLKDAFNEFLDDNATKLSASLAYSTIFSIGPLLLVIITLTGLFYKPESISHDIEQQLKGLVGNAGAEQIFAILNNIRHQTTTTLFGIIGGIVLLFGTTTVFSEIQSSINYIWSIRAKPKKSWLKFLTDRLLSFSLVVGLGFVLLVSLLISTVFEILSDRLVMMFGKLNLVLIHSVNHLIVYLIISFLFAIIYKVLPDGHIRWKDALIGASFTGFLFLIGKFLIGYYLGSSKLASTYGAAASLIVILSWVYYSSAILYFGAEFTKVYALQRGGGIHTKSTAVFIIKREAKEIPRSEDTDEIV